MLPIKPLIVMTGMSVVSACGGGGGAVTTDVSDALIDGSLNLAEGPALTDNTGVEDVDFATILNGLRTDRALPGFTYDARLDAAAQKHAQDMVDNDYFDHVGLNGSTVYDRIVAEGYDPRGWAENLAQGQQTQGAVLQDWIDSPGHNANLNADLENFAIGVAGSGRNLTWVLVLGTER